MEIHYTSHCCDSERLQSDDIMDRGERCWVNNSGVAECVNTNTS